MWTLNSGAHLLGNDLPEVEEASSEICPRSAPGCVHTRTYMCVLLCERKCVCVYGVHVVCGSVIVSLCMHLCVSAFLIVHGF